MGRVSGSRTMETDWKWVEKATGQEYCRPFLPPDSQVDNLGNDACIIQKNAGAAWQKADCQELQPRFCEFLPDAVPACDTQPCKNGATCLNCVDGFVCVCAPRWTGTNCTTKMEECDAIVSTFESDEPSAIMEGDSWVVSDKYLGNHVTGVSSPGSRYLGWLTDPYEGERNSEMARTGRFNSSFNFVLRFRYLERTMDLFLEVCLERCEDVCFLRCVWRSEPGYRRENWDWMTAHVFIPVGTRQIFFRGQNQGRNIGGIGIDDVQLLHFSPGVPLEEAHVLLC